MRVFFIGICGTAMGNVAVLLKKMGHEVAGSDSGIYPPMSDVLADAGIELFDGFAGADMTEWKPDRVVVGNAVSRGNPQVEYLLKERILPFVSLPQLIGEDLIGNRPSIVVAGTHGKTTTTALAAFTLHSLGLNPGYLIGGVPLDLPAGNELGNLSAPFVIEGDEYDSAFFDKRSKFIHYRPRVLVLNNLEFDHGDIFRDLEDISRSFSHLLRIVPSHGYVLRNGDDPNLLALPEAPWTQVYSVGTGENNDLKISDFGEDQTGSRFTLLWRGELVMEVNWAMPGLFNARNLTMAIFASCLTQREKTDGEEIDATIFQPMSKVSFGDCRGVKRRQEVLLDSSALVVLSDFAHHPTAISGALESLRARYPERKVIACFEPRSNTAVTNVFEGRFAQALALADQALIGAVHRAERIPETQRISPERMVRIITEGGKSAHAFDSNQALGKFLSEQSQGDERGNTLLVFFSNGSFDGVIQEFVKLAKTQPGMNA
jgi:UDP-N-acetylmuramate: L-alanyl-gamma-D-glutamyl-meso-diaminopimelate ligase